MEIPISTPAQLKAIEDANEDRKRMCVELLKELEMKNKLEVNKKKKK